MKLRYLLPLVLAACLWTGTNSHGAATWQSGQTRFWPAWGLTGGCNLCLDNISGVSIDVTDVAIAFDLSGNTVYFYESTQSGGAESGVTLITPDDVGAGNTRWELLNVYGATAAAGGSGTVTEDTGATQFAILDIDSGQNTVIGLANIGAGTGIHMRGIFGIGLYASGNTVFIRPSFTTGVSVAHDRDAWQSQFWVGGQGGPQQELMTINNSGVSINVSGTSAFRVLTTGGVTLFEVSSTSGVSAYWPTADDQVATKKYVDDNAGGIGGSGATMFAVFDGRDGVVDQIEATNIYDASGIFIRGAGDIVTYGSGSTVYVSNVFDAGISITHKYSNPVFDTVFRTQSPEEEVFRIGWSGVSFQVTDDLPFRISGGGSSQFYVDTTGVSLGQIVDSTGSTGTTGEQLFAVEGGQVWQVPTGITIWHSPAAGFASTRYNVQTIEFDGLYDLVVTTNAEADGSHKITFQDTSVEADPVFMQNDGEHMYDKAFVSTGLMARTGVCAYTTYPLDYYARGVTYMQTDTGSAEEAVIGDAPQAMFMLGDIDTGVSSTGTGNTVYFGLDTTSGTSGEVLRVEEDAGGKKRARWTPRGGLYSTGYGNVSNATVQSGPMYGDSGIFLHGTGGIRTIGSTGNTVYVYDLFESGISVTTHYGEETISFANNGVTEFWMQQGYSGVSISRIRDKTGSLGAAGQVLKANVGGGMTWENDTGGVGGSGLTTVVTQDGTALTATIDDAPAGMWVLGDSGISTAGTGNTVYVGLDWTTGTSMPVLEKITIPIGSGTSGFQLTLDSGGTPYWTYYDNTGAPAATEDTGATQFIAYNMDTLQNDIIASSNMGNGTGVQFRGLDGIGVSGTGSTIYIQPKFDGGVSVSFGTDAGIINFWGSTGGGTRGQRLYIDRFRTAFDVTGATPFEIATNGATIFTVDNGGVSPAVLYDRDGTSGASGEVLKAAAGGGLIWASDDDTVGAAAAGGNQNEFQYNSAGALAGSANLDQVTNGLLLTGNMEIVNSGETNVTLELVRPGSYAGGTPNILRIGSGTNGAGTWFDLVHYDGANGLSAIIDGSGITKMIFDEVANGVEFPAGVSVTVATPVDGSNVTTKSYVDTEINNLSEPDYLVLNSDANLTSERRFVAGSGVSASDGGAGATYEISVTASILDTGATQFVVYNTDSLQNDVIAASNMGAGTGVAFRGLDGIQTYGTGNTIWFTQEFNSGISVGLNTDVTRAEFWTRDRRMLNINGQSGISIEVSGTSAFAINSTTGTTPFRVDATGVSIDVIDLSGTTLHSIVTEYECWTVTYPHLIGSGETEVPIFTVDEMMYPNGIQLVMLSAEVTSGQTTYELEYEEWSESFEQQIEFITITDGARTVKDRSTINDAEIAAGRRIYLDLATTAVDSLHGCFAYYPR